MDEREKQGKGSRITRRNKNGEGKIVKCALVYVCHAKLTSVGMMHNAVQRDDREQTNGDT